MPIVKNPNRQDELVAHVVITAAMLAAGAFEPAVAVPAGAIITGGSVNVTTAFDGGGNLSVGEKQGADADVPAAYLAAGAVTVGSRALVPTGKTFAKGGSVGVKLSAAATVGEALLVVKYILANRAHSSEG